jgi:hypothetical protein
MIAARGDMAVAVSNVDGLVQTFTEVDFECSRIDAAKFA